MDEFCSSNERTGLPLRKYPMASYYRPVQLEKNSIVVLAEIATATSKRSHISLRMCLQTSNGNL